MLYSPSGWQTVSAAFALALSGNGTVLRELVPAVDDVILRGHHSLSNENFFNRTAGGNFENTQAIYCVDQGQDGDWATLTLKNGTSEQWVELLLR